MKTAIENYLARVLDYHFRAALKAGVITESDLLNHGVMVNNEGGELVITAIPPGNIYRRKNTMQDNQESPSKELDDHKGGDLSDKIEKILTLDKKRTQGEWQYSEGGYLPGCGDYDCDSIYLLDGKEKHTHPETGDELVFEVAGTVILGEEGDCLSKDIAFMSKAPEMVFIIKELDKQLTATQQALDSAKASISKMRIIADETRGYITARPANKPKANLCLLKIQQMSVFPAEEEAEMNKVAKEFVTELVASKKLDTAVEALKFYANPIDYKAPYTGGLGKLYYDCGTVAKAALASISGKEGI